MGHLEQQEIENLVKFSSLRLGSEHTNQLEITHDFDATQALIYIERLVRFIVDNKDDPLLLAVDPSDVFVSLGHSSIAKELIFQLCFSLPLIEPRLPIHAFNPYINLFIENCPPDSLLEAIKEHRTQLEKPNRKYDSMVQGRLTELALHIQSMVQNIQSAARTSTFQQALNNAKRNAKKNYDDLVLYIDSLFARYSRLLVIRVDFAYRMGNAIQSKDEITGKYQEAKSDFQRFLNNRKANRLFNHLVGYIWKLEYGLEKGFHYHVLLFYNGAKVRQDEKIAMLIGEYWKNNITSGRGLYYNCNASKSKYRSLGIGMINHDDVNLKDTLFKAAKYLTKVDHYARFLTPDKDRTFGRGEIKNSNQRRGRPRRVKT